MHHTEDFDQKLFQFDHLRRFPELLPFIGQHYPQQVQKVIFIGESHYLPEGSIVQRDPDRWYRNFSTEDLFKENERNWINTRQIITAYIDRAYSAKAHRIYQEIEKAIGMSISNPAPGENTLSLVAFYNYFQRPAEIKGGSIQNSDLDNETAHLFFHHLYSVLAFDHAIFVSKKAYYAFARYELQSNISGDYQVLSLPHPGCAWWNRKSRAYQNIEGKKRTGKEKLLDYLMTQQAFDK